MELIKQNEIDDAASDLLKNKGLPIFPNTTKDAISKESFKAGIEFTKSKFQEMFMDIITENQGLKLYKDNEAERFSIHAIKFADYVLDEISVNSFSSEDLYYQFLKDEEL